MQLRMMRLAQIELFGHALANLSSNAPAFATRNNSDYREVGKKLVSDTLGAVGLLVAKCAITV
jgi:hypothetical protein